MLLSSKIESQLTYKGFQCTIMFTPTGYRCGYVKLTPSDKYFKKTYNQIPLVCHGGITYTRDCLPGQMSEDECWYIGFDCGHSHDGIDLETYEIIYDSDLQLLGNNERDLITSSVVTMANVKSEYEYKSKEYVEKELKRIVDQITGDNYEEFI